MKNKLVYIYYAFALALLISGCSSPSPTEVVAGSQEDEEVKIETSPASSENSVYENGYDSVGIFSSVDQRFSSVISVSSVKTSDNSSTNKYYLAQALFFDKSKPVKGPKGEKLGYLAEPPGLVSFGNVPVKKEPFKLNFRKNGIKKDTAAGYYGVICSKAEGEGGFSFNYDSKINFTLRTISSTIKFEIPTPPDITGSVEVTGKQSNGFNINLQWNKTGKDSVDIILGAVMKADMEIKPIVYFKVKDSGHLKIPNGILSSLQYAKYSKLVFTFIRKKTTSNNLLKENYILAQSIHCIKVNIP